MTDADQPIPEPCTACGGLGLVAYSYEDEHGLFGELWEPCPVCEDGGAPVVPMPAPVFDVVDDGPCPF